MTVESPALTRFPRLLSPRRPVDWLPYAFIAPLFLLLLAISFYPALYAVWLAFTDASLIKLGNAHFIGFGNLLRMLHDSIFLGGLWRTLRWDVAVVTAEIAIGVPMALFLNLDFAGRSILRAAVLVPYIIPPAVTALMWVYMFDGNFGVANDALLRLGVIGNYVSWLSSPGWSFVIVAAAMVWSGQPLIAIVVLAVLQTIPKELYEAARVDGAGSWLRFRAVTLPHIVPTILFLFLLRMIWMTNNVDMIYIMTRGGPGFSNYTEAVYGFQLTRQFEIGYASAVAVVLALIMGTASIFYVRHLARSVLS